MHSDPAAARATAIYNAGWWVRWYCRPHQSAQNAAAIRAMGLAARAAFNSTEDFAPLLYAIARSMPSGDDDPRRLEHLEQRAQ